AQPEIGQIATEDFCQGGNQEKTERFQFRQRDHLLMRDKAGLAIRRAEPPSQGMLRVGAILFNLARPAVIAKTLHQSEPHESAGSRPKRSCPPPLPPPPIPCSRQYPSTSTPPAARYSRYPAASLPAAGHPPRSEQWGC